MNNVMRGIISTFFLFGVLFSGLSQQEIIKLKSGDLLLNDLASSTIASENEMVKGHYFRMVHFDAIPSQSAKRELKNNGIELLNYIPNNTFFASINQNADLSVLPVGSKVIEIQPNYKLTPSLIAEKYPVWTMASEDEISLTVFYFSTISEEAVKAELSKLNVTIEEFAFDRKTAVVKLSLVDLDKLYASPLFYYFEELPAPGEPENEPGRTLHRSNTLWTEYLGGLEYNGEGITVMMQDDGVIGPHIDYTGRIDQSNCSGCSTSTANDHGDHVAGTLMGAGNLDPETRGMAHGADLLVYNSFNSNYYSVPGLNSSSGLVITSKSYGNGCNAGYTTLTHDLDAQVNQLPVLTHVFSAGNSGTSNCGYGAGSGWGNITGGHKSGKNVIAVGNLNSSDQIANSSSRGPASDGRIKPDICAVGTSVYSTEPNNTYGTKTGTSMACPGVAGIITQLYDGYRDLNGGADPNAGLIKASVLNTAEDLGNDGPDFTYGWGRINARRAFDLLSNNQYYSGSIIQGDSLTSQITVPSGVKEVRIMVYWTDVEGTVSASQALVNDIDMTVVDPTNQEFQPWVLDHTPNASLLSQPAVRTVDHLNNMEQVTIDDPAAGNYTVALEGFSIPQGPQEYFVVYYLIYDEITVTYPIGGEGIEPGTSHVIRWDASDDTTPFTVEYTDDDGATWNFINTASASSRQIGWVPPSTTVSGLARVRITRGSVSDESDANFSIIRIPANLVINWACQDSLNIGWNAVSGATGYEVSMLGAKYMDSIGTTSATDLTIPFSSTAIGWFSVRALGPNNARGERADAIQKTPGQFSCPYAPPAAAFDYDCENPGTGYCLNFTDLSTNTATGATYTWYFPGGTPATSTQENPQVCYPSAGDYDVALVVTTSVGSDSIYQSNAVTILEPQALPYFEGFENYSTFTNIDEWTVNNPDGNGTFIISNAALSGTKSAMLANYSQNGVYTDELISGPIDLSSVASTGQVTLTYRYSYRKRTASDVERLQVWVTENCTDNWAVRSTLQGNTLSTFESASAWVPFQDSDWVTVHLTNITSQYFTSDFRFKFNFLSDGGNNLYIDNINLYEGAPSDTIVGLDAVVSDNLAMNVYPNPADNYLFVEFGLNDATDVQIRLLDLSGKMIQLNQIQGAYGNNLVQLSTELLSSGMYVVELVNGTQISRKRIVIE